MFKIRSAVYADWDVFRELITVLEDHDQVDMELDLESGPNEGGTRVDLREEHVERHLHVGHHVAIRDLDVLHFSCRLHQTFIDRLLRVLVGLDAHQLDLNRLDRQLGLLADQVPFERFIEATVG